MWEGEDGESSNRAELTVAEPCRSGRDAVLPTLAWAPEGWGCEGANEAPSRTSASASGDEVREGQVRALRAGGGWGGRGGWELVLTCCARMSKLRSKRSMTMTTCSSNHLPQQHGATWRTRIQGGE